MLNRKQLEQIIEQTNKHPSSSDLMYAIPDSDPAIKLKPAAVLVPLVERVDNAMNYHVLLTKRAAHLKHHAGQVSFPGGRQEEDDVDLVHTALRETYEEIGIPADLIDIVGQLPRHQTITQYEMTPIVGVVDPSYQMTIDKNEVDVAFEVPLDFICDVNNYQLREAEFQGRIHNYHVMQFEQYTIWGATARVLTKFADMINRFDHSKIVDNR